MPALEFSDGKMMGQSQSIMRYLGKMNGYYPKDSLEASKVDFMVENFNVFFPRLGTVAFLKGAEYQAEISEIFDKLIPDFMKKLAPNLSGNSFLCGGHKLTIADFWIGSLYTNFMNRPNIGYEK